MHRSTLLATLALALTTHTVAQGIDADDISPNCQSQCQAIVSASSTCERQYDDTANDDQKQLDCICDSDGLSTAIPECEACQRQFYVEDTDYDDVLTLLSACGLSTTSATGPSATATTTYTTTYTETEDDGDRDAETDVVTSVMISGGGVAAVTTTDSAGSTVTSMDSAATGAAGNAASSATDAAAATIEDQSGNLAPMATAAPVWAAAAGVAAVVFGV